MDIRYMMPNLTNRDTVQEELGPIVEKGFGWMLDRLLERRQTLISKNVIRETATAMRHMLGSQNTDPRLDFLSRVADYHKARNDPEMNTSLWRHYADRFCELGTSNVWMLQCYANLYAFLCQRNAGKISEAESRELLERSRDAIQHLETSQEFEALGHLHYNLSRYEAVQGETASAVHHWESASGFRTVIHQQCVLHRVDPGQELAMAQQVVKMRTDFPLFFPDVDIDKCGVSKALHDELVAKHGDAIFAFCVSRKK